MALPSAQELSRWTVTHVNSWLTKCSLSVFRDDFLRDGIDGSKLMRLKPYDVNQRYDHISSKKRNILIEYLKKIENSHPPPTWNASPHVLPRFGTNTSRPPPPPPVQHFDDSDESDRSWPDEFDDDDADDYLQVASEPLQNEFPSETAHRTNGNPQQMFDGPEEAYVIPEEDIEDIRQNSQKRSDVIDQREPATAAPPPRPPRKNMPPAGESPSMERRQEAVTRRPVSPARHRLPPPVPDVPPPDDMYVVMNDVISETQKAQKTVLQPSAAGADVDLPPRPVRQGPQERAPEPQPAERRAQKPRYAYQEVKKPGRLRQEEQDELSVYDWYHGKIGRDRAHMIFEREKQDGMFLVRKSERDPKQPYTLVIWHCNRIWNIPIRKKDNANYAAGKFKDGESEFDSVSEIVEHFKVVSLNLKSDSAVQGSHTLTTPAPRH